MIKTTFRIEVETSGAEGDLLDAFALARVFKCAPARHVVVPDGGLGRQVARTADDADAGDGAADVVAELKTAGELLAQIVSITGRNITPEAIDVYRETQAMRRSFGIPKGQRSHTDPAKKLPKILAEPFEKFDPAKLVSTANLPKTRRDLQAEALAAFPRELPTLALRVSILHRPLWEKDDPVARQNWKKVVYPQTLAMVEALQRDLLRLEVPSNLPPELVELLRFTRLELRFDRYALSIANDDVNRFGKVGDVLSAFYDFVNSDVLDRDQVVRVDVPFIDYDALTAHIERELAQQAAADADAADEADADAADEAAVEAGAAAGDADGGAPALADDGAGDDGADAEAAAEGDAAAAADDADAVAQAGAGTADDEGADEPPSRTHGIVAVRLAEQTVSDTRAHEREFRALRAERLRQEAQAIESLKAKGIDIPTSARKTTWGVIGRDGGLRYLDSVAAAFRDRPAATPDDDVDIVDFAAQAEARSQAAAAAGGAAAPADSQHAAQPQGEPCAAPTPAQADGRADAGTATAQAV